MPPKRRRKIHGLYFHSSPPKVFPMNNQMRQRAQDNGIGKEAIVIKPSNIRIWIHDKDIGKLAKVLWEGQGNRLRTEVSTNNKVRKFLEAVPYVMNIIKDIHSAVIDNDLDYLIAKTASPVPKILLSSKDANGLTPLHKAAGLAHTRIVEHLLREWPESATEMDGTGKTPLHWAASAKNNNRAYNLLTQAGSDEQAMDFKMKTPNYYKNKPNDIDRSLLTIVPDAPRVPQQGLPPGYDWQMFGDDTSAVMNNDNNFVKKSKSTYDSYTILNDESSSLRRASSDAIRNGNILSSVVPGAKNRSSIDNNRNSLDTSSDPIIPENGEELSAPLTTEEMAVLVAINPENEALYKHPNTNPSARSEESISKIIGNNNNEISTTKQNETGETDEMTDTNDTNEPQSSENHNKNESDHTGNINQLDSTVDELNNSTEPEAQNETEDNGNENETEAMGEHVNDKGDEENFDETHEADEDKTERNVDEDIEDNDESTIVDNQSIASHDDDYDENFEKIVIIQDQEIHDDTEDENENENKNENEEENQKETDQLNENESNETKNDDGDEEGKKENVEGEDNADMENEDKESKNHNDGDEVTATASEIATELDDAETEMADETKEENEDENVQEEDEDEGKEVSPSPAMQIELMVRGEPDNGGVQSESGNFHQDETDDDPNIRSFISAGDMEQLAALVLNGEGRKLIGLSTDQAEIQAFLDNVPAYMNKIRRVHVAAREGSLRDLQAALDRRKFAVAKDDISPNGGTPLHVATIFGHAGIVRYLAGRFPETTAATDNNGRSALHYAATIHDNGHFYNLLTHLGANPKAEDNMGNSAEFYMNHEQSNDILSHRQLLKDFGAHENFADDMLNDQGNNQVEIPLFRTEEGRYLATTLGDPLIKGLTEVANSRPTDPIAFLANYLHGFASKQTKMSGSEPLTNEAKIEEEPEKSVEAENLPKAFVAPVSVTPIPTNVTSVVENSIENTDEVPATPDEGPEMAETSDERDEHGQSLLHFACARSHARNALVQLIEESGVSLAYRDELYRTARDVSLQAGQPENAKEIDRFILGFAARGELEIFEDLLMDGYDNIVTIEDNNGVNIADVAKSRGHKSVADFLEGIPGFEANREQLHRAIRNENIAEVKRIAKLPDGAKIVRAKNYYGRCSLHIAVLKENEEIVEYLASNFKQSLRIGDNLERTPLHYAMGVSAVEALSRILIKNGAKRVLKDLKGRQASYYFMNKADILRLKEEEEVDEDME